MITLWKPTRVNNALTSIELREMDHENETGRKMPSNISKTIYPVQRTAYVAYTLELVDI